MTLSTFLGEALGFLAGGIVSTSALPRIVSIYRNPKLAAKESLPRNAALTFGNMLWVISGILHGLMAIVIMCGIAAILNGIVMVSTILARR